ncbi:MAG: hypothetical protein R3F31_20620 [Verrucomicrobiales bacterium]
MSTRTRIPFPVLRILTVSLFLIGGTFSGCSPTSPLSEEANLAADLAARLRRMSSNSSEMERLDREAEAARQQASPDWWIVPPRLLMGDGSRLLIIQSREPDPPLTVVLDPEAGVHAASTGFGADFSVLRFDLQPETLTEFFERYGFEPLNAAP